MHDARQMILIRLIAGAILNMLLLLMIPRIAVWSSVEREFRLALTASSIGAVAIVCLIPVVWRAKGRQQVFALVLMVFPCLSIWVALDFVASYG